MTELVRSSRDVIVRTPDVKAAAEFYEKVLGLAVTRRIGGIVGFETGALQTRRTPNRSGGPHDSDWRCVNRDCRHFNTIKRRACSKCNTVSPQNGRMRRKALGKGGRGSDKGHLGKHGLWACQRVRIPRADTAETVT
jgi:Glyoxalase/Bleomycin resistance protein/Dioxygenase superfamily